MIIYGDYGGLVYYTLELKHCMHVAVIKSLTVSARSTDISPLLKSSH